MPPVDPKSLVTAFAGVLRNLVKLILFSQESETKDAGETVIAREIEEIKRTMPAAFEAFARQYELTKQGTRDLYF